MTVGLLAVVVYLYTVVAFNFFRKFYNMSEDEDEPDMKCDDMMTVSGGLHLVEFHSLISRLTVIMRSLSVLSVPHVRGCASRWRYRR